MVFVSFSLIWSYFRFTVSLLLLESALGMSESSSSSSSVAIPCVADAAGDASGVPFLSSVLVSGSAGCAFGTMSWYCWSWSCVSCVVVGGGIPTLPEMASLTFCAALAFSSTSTSSVFVIQWFSSSSMWFSIPVRYASHGAALVKSAKSFCL